MPYYPVSVSIVSHGSVQIKERGSKQTTQQRQGSAERGKSGIVERYEGLRQAVMAGAVAMTDGSFKDKHATAAWGVKQDTDDKRYVARDTVVSSGHPKIQSVYRSELTGILALVRAVNVSCGPVESGQGSVEVGQDCLSAITIITQEWELQPTATLQGNLMYSIRKEIWNSNVTWTSQHVLGHQDYGVGMTELDGWAKMNVGMDAVTKEAWEETKKRPEKGTRQYHGGLKYTRNIS